MLNTASPLRYPGGKACLVPFFRDLIEQNAIKSPIFVEPFCGGAAAALHLLFSEHVDRIVLNDKDPSIFAFWWAVTKRADEFIERIQSTEVTIEEYQKQKIIYKKRDMRSKVSLGFATFFLNRCNRSGIISSAGPIGGFEQSGEWKLDVRFNKVELINRINRIASFSGRIEVLNMDGIELLVQSIRRRKDQDRFVVFLDPPYVVQGDRLYSSDFDDAKHRRLAKALSGPNKFKWILTYDDHRLTRELYSHRPITSFSLQYSAQSKRKGKEIIVVSESLAC